MKREKHLCVFAVTTKERKELYCSVPKKETCRLKELFDMLLWDLFQRARRRFCRAERTERRPIQRPRQRSLGESLTTHQGPLENACESDMLSRTAAPSLHSFSGANNITDFFVIVAPSKLMGKRTLACLDTKAFI